MCQSDIGDGLHLAAAALCIQMSQERQREGAKEGGTEADRGRQGECSFLRQLVMCSCLGGWITPQSLSAEGGEEREMKTAREKEREKESDMETKLRTVKQRDWAKAIKGVENKKETDVNC